jgi:hypothetical protein
MPIRANMSSHVLVACHMLARLALEVSQPTVRFMPAKVNWPQATPVRSQTTALHARKPSLFLVAHRRIERDLT